MDTLNKIKHFFTWLFVLIGLVLVLVGSVGFLNLALKVYLFPKADRNYCPPPILAVPDKRVIPPQEDYYKQCLENQSSQRQKDAAQSLAFLISGLPVLLFFYRKTKNET